MITQRISAGGIVVKDNKILLVRYNENNLRTNDNNINYLVAPGGKMEDGESLAQTAEREIKEETNIIVKAHKPVAIENLRGKSYHMVKIWYLCNYISGEVTKTIGAEKEGITEVGWYSDEELESEIVFPGFIKELKIDGLNKINSIIDMGFKHADFD